jgi:S-formylglutathione hydrolase FrmB
VTGANVAMDMPTIELPALMNRKLKSNGFNAIGGPSMSGGAWGMT